MEKCKKIFENMDEATPADWRYLRMKLGVVVSDRIIRSGHGDPDKLYVDEETGELRYQGVRPRLAEGTRGLDRWMRFHIHDLPEELLAEIHRPRKADAYEFWRYVK